MAADMVSEVFSQRLSHVVPVCCNAECCHVDGLEAGVATRVDCEERLQIHFHVEAHTVITAAVADFQPERCDLCAWVGKLRRRWRDVDSRRALLSFLSRI